MAITATSRKHQPPEYTKEEASHIEQRVLTLSLYGVIFIAFGSLFYGLYIQSDVVILNGIFSMFSLMGSWLNLTAARLVARPADKRFQYGYWHVEPMVHCVNALMMCIICLYAFVNGIEGLRQGGAPVDNIRVIAFSVVTAIFCGGVGFYERFMARQTGSQLLENDSREWLMDFGFSMITLVGFGILFFLPEGLGSRWAYYADSAMVSIMALILLPFPLRVLRNNLREVLRITHSKESMVGRVEEVLRVIKQEHPIISYSHHILKVGRTYFVEVNILVGENFPLRSIVEHDILRDRIWKACDKPLDEIWLSVCFTADPRWA